MFPLVIISSADRHLNVVDFPAPFTPNRTKHSFFWRLNEILFTAFTTDPALASCILDWDSSAKVA